MTIPNTFVNGTVADGTEVNSNFNYSTAWTKIKSYNADINVGIITFDATTWSTADRRTTDAGVSWAAPGYGTTAGEDIAAYNGINGICGAEADGSTAFSANSGLTWGASSTQPPEVSAINSMNILGSTAICGGNSGSVATAWYSSDYGDNWTQSAGNVPPAESHAVSLASSTIGYLTDSTSIYRTTDGGENWVDTTEDWSPTVYSIVATDTDTVYGIARDKPILLKYVNSTTTASIVFNFSNIAGQTSNLIKATNGDLCFVFWPTPAVGETVQLTLFVYDGTNGFMKQMGIPENDASAGIFDTTEEIISSISEADNVIYININDHILEVKLA